MKLEKSTRNAILPSFTRHNSEMSIKLFITFCDLSVNRNVSRCHAVLSTLRQVGFDGRIIRLSRLLIRSGFPGSPLAFYSTACVSTWPRIPLRCVNARYSLVSFPEVQTLDISKCRRESQPIPARRYYFSSFPLPSRPVRERETATDDRREESQTRRSENTFLKLSLSAEGSPRPRRLSSR